MLVTISVTSFLKIVTLIMLIMLITIHLMPVHQTLFLSLLNFQKTAKEFGFSVKLLGMQISNNLNFEYHMNQLCKKAKNSMFC